ncbi:MAG: beta-lactamase family protein [Clostridiales bacterium]|nr:beta-lactamase family protein [Clostridiales bacterium]
MKKSVKILAGILSLSILAASCSKKEEETRSTRTTKESETAEETVESTTEESSSEETTKETTKETTEETTTEATTTEETTSESTAEETTEGSSEETSAESTSASSSASSRTFDKGATEKYFDSIKFDGVALVSQNRNIIWTKESGLADREQGIPNSMDKVYELGSITKQFTAVAIMQLVEQGKISTEDTLDKYIPEYSHAKEITIHQLLNMTSGISDYLETGTLGISMSDLMQIDFTKLDALEQTVRSVVTKPITGDWMIEQMSYFDLEFTPGTQFKYCNTNYYFLGIIIERLTGMKYDEYIRKNILEPLNLTELYPDIDHLTTKGRTSLLFWDFDFPSQDPTISYAVGVMTGTAEGLLKWEYAVLDGALLTKESWDKIFDGGAFGYGYGFYVEGHCLEHSGMTLGYNTDVFVDRDTEDIIIILSNTQTLGTVPMQPLSGDISEYMQKNCLK